MPTAIDSIAALRSRRLGPCYGTNRLAVDLGCNRSLQQAYLDYQVILSFQLKHCPVYSGQRTVLDRDRLSCLQKGPRLAMQARIQDGPQRVDFVLVNWSQNFAEAYNSGHAWRREYWQPPRRVKPAKHIARK